MITNDMEKLYPSAKTLVKENVASRIHDKDATLYGFSEEAEECARNFMGWADLASNPPLPLDEIQAFADSVVASGITNVVLIGQGGSSQAPMTVSKYDKQDRSRVTFRIIDSDSPVRLRELLATSDPQSTLVVISSKSGGTIEVRTMLRALRNAFSEHMSQEELVRHLVAVTDPGSALEKQAQDEGWLAVFNGEPTVGGRFSALSVFGLLPAALIGIDLNQLMQHAREAERLCSENSIDNPAINLAAFLYDNYLKGRNKFSFFTPKRGRALGLWIEQLVAESLGKDGQGILPSIEVDSLMLTNDPGDRSAIMYQTKTALWDESKNFEMSMAYVDPAIPRLNYKVDSVMELAEHFVMWEYAIAMCGYLMKLSPFDQPDVASAKAEVLDILRDGQPAPDFTQEFIDDIPMGEVEVRVSPQFTGMDDLRNVLRALISSVRPNDYFALNAFLPFTGEGRREALEKIRHSIADNLGVVSCLEVGPRYLHSTGQLQKGGPNIGVFLILSADELKDIPVDDEVGSLGNLAKAQAAGDLITLADRGRRVVHVHLPDNSGVTLRALAEVIIQTVEAVAAERAAGADAALSDAEVAAASAVSSSLSDALRAAEAAWVADTEVDASMEG